MRLPDETAGVMEKIFDLLGALKAADPMLAALLDSRPARFSFDVRERAMLVSVVTREDGYAEAIACLTADPFDRGGFGELVIPLALQPAGETEH